MRAPTSNPVPPAPAGPSGAHQRPEGVSQLPGPSPGVQRPAAARTGPASATREPKPVRVIVDSREQCAPDAHPWSRHFSPAVVPVAGSLETGDFALAALPDAAVVERKTVADLYGCLGQGRERFERELQRGRHVGAFVVVVEGSFADLLAYARARGGGMSQASIVGTLAAWTRRFCPFVFCGDVATSAEFAERFLLGQVREAERTAKALAREDRRQP